MCQQSSNSLIAMLRVGVGLFLVFSNCSTMICISDTVAGTTAEHVPHASI